jgi:hypothetical protein
VRRLVLDELGNFIDSESGRILLAAASWLKTFMMPIAIPVVALGAGETVFRARDGRLFTTNATAVLGCSTAEWPISAAPHARVVRSARPTLGAGDGRIELADHYQACGDEFTHLLLKLDDGCLGLRHARLAELDIARRLYYATDSGCVGRGVRLRAADGPRNGPERDRREATRISRR